jgi:hypothetical protein
MSASRGVLNMEGFDFHHADNMNTKEYLRIVKLYLEGDRLRTEVGILKLEEEAHLESLIAYLQDNWQAAAKIIKEVPANPGPHSGELTATSQQAFVFGTRVGLNISGFAMLRGVRNRAAFVVKGLEKDKPKIFKGNATRESHVNIIIHMFVEAIRALQDGQPSAYLGALLNKSLVQVEVKSYLRQHDGESNADFEIRELRDNYEKSDKRCKRLDFIIGQLKNEIKSKEATETKSAREKKALHQQTERLQESIDERCEAEKMKNARLERDIVEQKSKIVEVENDRNSGNHKRARVEGSLEEEKSKRARVEHDLEEAQSKIAHLEHLEHDLMEEKKKSAQLEHDLMSLIEQSKPVGQPTSLLNKVEDMNGRFEQTYRDLNRRFGQE